MSGFQKGTVVAERYRIERSLARGGMAEVFVARDLSLDRLVALKILAAGLSSDPSFVARFRREAQAAAGLSHPNIVAVYDWGAADDSYFIAMEYVPGRTLKELIAAEAPLPTEQTALIGAQIAAALAAAHLNGVVHRDIKPANVIFDANNAVKVTDFGIAHLAADAGSQLTATGMVLGTPAYLSPEQAEGRAVDGRSDLYSLGVVLYELATGTPPFRGDTTPAVVHQHAREPLEPPRRRNPAIPAALDTTITQLLAKDPEQRPASAELVEQRLRELAAGGEVAATVPMETAATRVMPARRRRPAWALTALLAAALAAIGFLVAHSLASNPGVGTTAASNTTSPSTTTTSRSTTTTSLPTSFVGYQVVAGSGAGALFCPDGISLGKSGEAPAAKPGHPHPGSGPDGSNGAGGRPGCGSNAGMGGNGGKGAPDAPGGRGGNGGNGGCQPETLAQMQHGARPCDGTGSDGGDGGRGGDSAPGARGGSGGAGGAGGNTTNAKGGKGGDGGNAKPGQPGGNGGPGGRGGGPNGTTAGVKGQDGTPGTKH